MTRAQNRSRWIAPSFAAAVIGLSACGSPGSTSSVDTGGTSPSLEPQVIHVAGGGATPQASESMAAADSKMAMWGGVNYVYEGTPPDLTGPATAWYFSPADKPSTDEIAAIAKALGVSGDVTELPADQGGGWLVGSSDYTTPTLSVGSDAMYTWYYSAPTPMTAASAGGCSGKAPDVPPPGMPTDADAATDAATDVPAATIPAPSDTTIDCSYVEPEPPTGILTADEAKARGTALFQSLGVDLSSYDVETYADDWSASVSATLKLEGVRTNVTISAGYGADGVLTWANGFLGTPQRGADYDRVGVAAAVERLNQQNSVWMGYGAQTLESRGSGMATDSVAPAGEPAIEPAVEPANAPVPTDRSVVVDPPMTGEPIACPDDAASKAAVDCEFPGPITPPNPEPITITLTNARPALDQLWADDGTIWLLPAYAFDSADGGIYTVIAVPDEYIQVAAPVPGGVPVEGGSGEQPVDTAIPPGEPQPEPAVSEPTTEVTPTTEATQTKSTDVTSATTPITPTS